MKALIFAVLMTISAIAQAEWTQLPAASVSEKTLGGTVLMLQMKYTLVVEGREVVSLTKELGDAGKKDFFKKMVMNEPAASLQKEFARADRPATNAVVAKYMALTRTPPSLSVN